MTSVPCRIAAGLAVWLPILLAGCVSSLLETEPVATFSLRGAAGSSPEAGPSRRTGRDVAVAVERPIASGAVASDRIVVEVGDQVQFVSGARWEDDVPTLLAADMARVLQDVNGIDVVDAAQRAGRADFGLVTVIDRMQVQLQDDYTGKAVAEIGARLVKLPDREIVATSTFRGEAAAANDAPDTLAQAISAATQQALSELVAWVAAQTR
jgi:cholesterol transport system auxiliary component